MFFRRQENVSSGRSDGGLVVFDNRVVTVAVEPPLAWFGRRDIRMARCASMLGGVAMRTVVATACPAAALTRPQMDPSSADLDAVLALTSSRMFDGFDCIDVATRVISHRRLSYWRNT